MSCILLIAYVGWCIDSKNMRGTNNTGRFMMFSVITNFITRKPKDLP